MIRFGTDGIRGTAGSSPCTAEVGLQIGRAAARLARAKGGGAVFVGRDTRPSGDMLSAAVIAGVLAAGCEARDAGVVPTAAIAESVAASPGTAGVMITASHNPWPDNGFKVLLPGGHKPDDQSARRIEAWIAEPAAQGVAPGERRDVHGAVVARWAERALAAVGDLGDLRRQKVVFDLAHGAATGVVDAVRSMIPRAVIIGGGDGRTNDGCGSEQPEALAAAVREHGAYAGLAVDGDADRCRLVDAAGEVVSGDALAWWLARSLEVPALAVTVMSNAALETCLPGVEVVRTPVGDRHLAAAMRERGIPLGCEESGHVLFADGLVAGDGLVTGLRALAHAVRSGPLRACLDGFTPLPRAVAKVVVRRRPALAEVPGLVAASASGEDRLGPGGRVFLRYSGTEPVLRILVEGDGGEVPGVLEALVDAATRELA